MSVKKREWDERLDNDDTKWIFGISQVGLDLSFKVVQYMYF